MSKPNVMLIGKMASGKSHVARFLRDKHGYQLISLAQPIKDIEQAFYQFEDDMPDYEYADNVWRILGKGKVINNEQYWEFIKILEKEVPKIPREKPKPRKRLQYIGTEIGRDQISMDLWIDIALEKIKNEQGSFVIEDLRFRNEYTAFKAEGFRPIKLIVSPEIQQKRLEILYDLDEDKVSLRANHTSEVELDRISVEKENQVSADQNLIIMYEEIELKLGLK